MRKIEVQIRATVKAPKGLPFTKAKPPSIAVLNAAVRRKALTGEDTAGIHLEIVSWSWGEEGRRQTAFAADSGAPPEEHWRRLRGPLVVLSETNSIQFQKVGES